MKPITDALLDQLSDEMKMLAVESRSRANVACESDERQVEQDMAELMEYVAYNRPVLVRFAFLLRGNASKQSAIREITGGHP